MKEQKSAVKRCVATMETAYEPFTTIIEAYNMATLDPWRSKASDLQAAEIARRNFVDAMHEVDLDKTIDGFKKAVKAFRALPGYGMLGSAVDRCLIELNKYKKSIEKNQTKSKFSMER